MKKYKYLAFGILVIVAIILTIVIVQLYRNKNDDATIDSKTKAEIEHLDSTLIDIFNSMNNIKFENYKISTSKIEQKTSDGEEDSSSGQSTSDSKGGSGSQASSSSKVTNGEDQGDSQSKDDQKYELEETGILTNDDNINWDDIKNNIEHMYASLSGMTLDLYQTNINNQDIIDFNKEYDNLTKIAKEEDKEATLSQLSKLYEFVPKFAENCISDNMEKSIFKVKNHIFKAYSLLEKEDWNQISKNVDLAVQEIGQMLASTDKKEQDKEYNINKAYVITNELKNCIELKDKEVFLIKYKNLLEELENM